MSMTASKPQSRAERARNLRYKRPALASLGYESLRAELEEIQETCADVHYYIDQDDDTLLNALDGDEEQAFEFKIAFADLEAKAEQLDNAMQEWWSWDEDEFGRTYNDCTVALIGNRYAVVGFDMMEEDYFSLTAYERNLAQTEAGKRLMRKTKSEIISTIGQCTGLLIAFLDLRQQHDYLKATLDILRDENTVLLAQIKELEAAYRDADEAGWRRWYPEVERFNQLLACVPDRAWIE